MIQIDGRTILIGGFHDHWFRNGTHNPTLLLAAMNYYHYDFMCMMDSTPMSKWFKEVVERYCPHVKLHLGWERSFGWGHVVSVYPKAPALPSDDPDFRKALSRLAAEDGLVALAHPGHTETYTKIFKTGEIDRLIDDGCMHAVELCTEEEYEWFRARDAAGKVTPILSGWDHHLIEPVRGLEPVLYGPRKPDGHIDTCDGTRTLVFAEENTWEALLEGVKAGRTVIDRTHAREFVGPAELVKFLDQAGYRERMDELDARRDSMTLAVDRLPVAGERLRMTFSRPGKVRMPGSLDEPREFETDADGALEIENLPVLMERDVTYFPVVETDETGYTRVWAVQLDHPIQLDVLPLVEGGETAVEVRPAKPFRGEVTLSLERILPKAEIGTEANLVFPVPKEKVTTKPVDYVLEARTRSGVTRRQSGYLTFIPVPRFRGDWSKVAASHVDSADYCGGYGSNRPYPGKDVFSGEIRFAWTTEEFLFRARVVDPVHYQTFKGHFVYQADALQLALDPMLRRNEIPGNVYSFNLALTPDGPEVFRWLSPVEEASVTFDPPEQNVTLGGEYLKVEKREKGLIYELRLPWKELAPAKPAPGMRMGVFFLMKNNNGRGLVDAMQWPRPIRGMWIVPRRWGVLTLVD